VALLVAAAVGLAVALAAVAAYITIRHELQSNLDDSLRSRAVGAAQTPLIQTLDTNRQQADTVSQALAGLASDVRLAIVDSSQTRAASGNLGASLGAPEFSVASGIVDQSLRTITINGSKYRVVAVPMRPGLALVLAQSTAATDHELNRMALVMVVVGGGGIVLAAMAGLSVAQAGLKPVEQLTAATEHIARTEDLRPIPVRGTDELARLTTSFNTMLGALAQSRERQRQLIADAGHELRTPLTSLRTNLDLLAQIDRSDSAHITPQDRAELLDDVQAQLSELTVLVGDLVELARTETPRSRPNGWICRRSSTTRWSGPGDALPPSGSRSRPSRGWSGATGCCWNERR
jgi:two-component system sensor histidine kinase MprB